MQIETLPSHSASLTTAGSHFKKCWRTLWKSTHRFCFGTAIILIQSTSVQDFPYEMPFMNKLRTSWSGKLNELPVCDQWHRWKNSATWNHLLSSADWASNLFLYYLMLRKEFCMFVHPSIVHFWGSLWWSGRRWGMFRWWVQIFIGELFPLFLQGRKCPVTFSIVYFM